MKNTLDKIHRYNLYVLKKAYVNDLRFGVPIDMIRILFISQNNNERDRLLLNAKKGDSREIEKVHGALLFATYDDVLEILMMRYGKLKILQIQISFMR